MYVSSLFIFNTRLGFYFMPKFSVKKPFTVLVGVIVALILGVVSLTKMQLDLLPEVSLPYLLVITTYPGASAQKVENDICEPMEASMGVINGVKNVYSICSENYGIVELEFEDNVDIDSAMVKVSAAINTLESTLPEECGTPTIMELSADMLATQYLAVGMDGMSIEELSQFTVDKLVPSFERIEGVASVTSLGLIEKTIEIDLDKEKVDDLNDRILAVADDKFADALVQLDEAKEKLEDSQVTIDKNKKKLVDSQKDLEDGRQDLVDGQKELDDGKQELADNRAKLNDSKEEMEKGREELDKTKKDTYDQLAAASDALDQLNSYKTQLTNRQADLAALEAAKAAVDAQIPTLTATLPTIPGSCGSLDNNPNDGILSADELSVIEATMLTPFGLSAASLDGKSPTDVENAIIEAINAIIASSDSYQKEIDALKVEIEVTKGVIAGYESKLDGKTYADIDKAKLEAATGFGSADAQLTMGQATLESTEAQLDSAEDSLEDAQKQIDDGWKSLEDGQTQINEGWDSIRDGEKQLADGWDDYNDAVKQYEKQKAEALKKANADDLLSLQTLASLVYAQNFAMPAGYVDDKNDNSWLIEVGDNFRSIEELEQSVLCHIDDVGDVRLCDVANITIIDNSMDSFVRLDGNQAVMLSIFKASTSGTNEVSKLCKEKVKELEEEYPGLDISIQMDQGDYINLIVKSVLQSMIIGASLAIIILAIFMKDAKPTLVVAISIPLSVLVTLICMYFSGISLNMLSLSGIALGIGMLVDNSVVVIENIYRLRSRGVEAPRAAVQGTKQVAGAIISSTLTTVCVFLPMIYTTGLVNELMMPMCLSIIFCLLASLVIAMTVVPASGSTILKNAKPKEHPLFDRVLSLYEKALGFCLRVKVVPILIAVALLGLTIWQVIRMGIVMIPEMSANQIQATLSIEDEEKTKEECYAIAGEVIEELMEVEGVGTVAVMDGDGSQLFTSGLDAGNNNFRDYSFMILTEDPDAGAEEITRISREMEAKVAANNEGVDFGVQSAMEEMSQLFGSGLSISIYGTDTQDMLEASHRVMDVIGNVEGYTDISNGEEDADKVIHLVIDKNKAMSMGLSVAQIYQDIATKLTTSADSVKVTIDGIDMQVTIVNELEPLNRENLMNREFTVEVVDEDGDTVTEEHKLSEFASEVIRDGVTTINRENQTRYMNVTANVAEGYNTTLLTRELEPMLEDLELPGDCYLKLGGEYDTVVEMIKQMALVLLLGAAFIYLVMVAQFQSLLSPFIVLFTIPLAFTGGLFSLWIARENLSVISLMGFVVLMGTVVNNGIVFVDYANQLRKGGLDRRTALIATGKTRMRPILMTALTTILAESNLIFGDDMGSQMGRGMALVIAGGLAYATLMTLFIIPVMYDTLFKKQPLDVDTGSEDLDDIPDDAAEYMAEMGKNG